MQVEEMKIRLPLPMKEWLRARAEENSRTLNGEILHLIKREIANASKEQS